MGYTFTQVVVLEKNPRPKRDCVICNQPMIQGESTVQLHHGNHGSNFAHFDCAVEDHLRQQPCVKCGYPIADKAWVTVVEGDRWTPQTFAHVNESECKTF